MKFLPTLYKELKYGKVDYWKAFVYEDPDHSIGYIVEVESSNDLKFYNFYKPKFEGKKNEISPCEIAHSKAVSLWEKQKKKGYSESFVKN